MPRERSVRRVRAVPAPDSAPDRKDVCSSSSRSPSALMDVGFCFTWILVWTRNMVAPSSDAPFRRPTQDRGQRRPLGRAHSLHMRHTLGSTPPRCDLIPLLPAADTTCSSVIVMLDGPNQSTLLVEPNQSLFAIRCKRHSNAARKLRSVAWLCLRAARPDATRAGNRAR